MCRNTIILSVLFVVFNNTTSAQDQTAFNSGWKCINAGKLKVGGQELSLPSYPTRAWLAATVPGTVLTTLIDNKIMPDPFYGMNNEKIPDIYTKGRDYYTYWFVKDFNEPAPAGDNQVWLHLRGVNYSCEVYCNGYRLNPATHRGMYLRQTYNITALLRKEGNNRLAIIVYPPDPVGNPNGGQGGDGEIARNVTHQYVAGWDWIQPIRDRNTGIWDQVCIERTGPVNIGNPHIITLVPGTRTPEAAIQAPAFIRLSAELENSSAAPIRGTLQYNIEGQAISLPVSLSPHARQQVQLPDHQLIHPRLWWPNGYGPQSLYHTELVFIPDNGPFAGSQPIAGKTSSVTRGLDNDRSGGSQPVAGIDRTIGSRPLVPAGVTGPSGSPSDRESLTFGIREVTTTWNSVTRSRQAFVNGQPVFIKGGNWIVSDELLRFTPERYDAEIRFHRDMNLNLIRVWGGALTERPEFYDACDKYGILVFQDFWNSGDCNGRWLDPQKKEDQWTRRGYPDDHGLFMASVIDQVKMIRNHPSLAFWCGGNEITPTDDLLLPMKDSILSTLDGTRYFFDYSNSDSMSFNAFGGNGDGPYGVQPIRSFWADRTFPFNSEVGSVGLGDYESLQRFLPKENLVAPQYPGKEDSVWAYHKYIGYDSTIYAYGPVRDLRDFTRKAQLVNYDQYRALMEGYSAHMWEWYTGSIIWKTQNPWTALRGQMYDYYLDPNACLYGLHSGSEPLHVMFDPVEKMVMIVNNTFSYHRNMMLEVRTWDREGKDHLLTQVFEEIGPSAVRKYLGIGAAIDRLGKKEGIFLSLRLLDGNQPTGNPSSMVLSSPDTAQRTSSSYSGNVSGLPVLSENFYWLPDSSGQYSGLREMAPASLSATAHQTAPGRIMLTLHNPAGKPVAFFNRISLLDPPSRKRILPVFYSDNYVSVVPGAEKIIRLEYRPGPDNRPPQVCIQGWNLNDLIIPVR